MGLAISYSPDEIKQKLNEILESSEFEMGLLERANQWIGHVIYTLIQRMTSIQIGNISLLWYIIGLITTVLFVLFVYWIIQALQGGTIDSGSQKAFHGQKYGRRYSQKYEINQVHALAHQGKFSDALRVLYGVSLIRLEKMGVARVDYARTDREYLDMVYQRAPEIYDAFLRLTDLVEKKWYAMQPCNRNDFEQGMTFFSQLGTGGKGGGNNQ